MIESAFDPKWEEVFRSHEWGKYPSEHVIRFVARAFYKAADRKAVRILDLGSGPGACTWYVAREGFAASAIDGSATAIQRLVERLRADSLEVDACVGDVIRLPWPDATFDGVIDNACLCCNPLDACNIAVGEVHRVLKPGGRFCSASFTDRTWGFGAGDAVGHGGFSSVSEGPLENRGFQQFFGRAQIDELFAAFEDRSVELQSWTMANMTRTVEQWVVTCRKRG